MTTYRRVITGVSTFIFIIHKLNKLLLKYEGRILQWAFAHLDVDQMQLLTDMFNLIHQLDPILQGTPDD